MTGQTKALLIALILVGGVLLALPFRHSGQDTTAIRTVPAQEKVWLRKTDWKPVEAEAAIPDTGEQTDTRPDEPIVPPVTPPVEFPDPHSDLTPIETPADQRPSASLGHTLIIPHDVVPVRKPETDAPAVEQPSSPRSQNVPARSAAQKSRVIKHVVRDGDTLPSLARRYLGDARRAIEIFNANRDKLRDPKMLPVNEELLIEVQR